MNNQKTPTMLLLTPDERFHTFGFTARDFYNDLDQTERPNWFFFERFKMNLHHDQVQYQKVCLMTNPYTVNVMGI